jgi:hypothetical protein
MTNIPSLSAAPSCQHVEAKLDPIVRAETCYFVGNQIIESIGCRLALYNCAACGSTISVPLPGHVDDDDWNDATPVVSVSDLSCRRDLAEDVTARPGYVGAQR